MSHANPFLFYVISGSCAGSSSSDPPLLAGGIALLALNVVLWAIRYSVPVLGGKSRTEPFQ